ncbi:MAG: efflux transporter periplasmic adaptor subunit [Rhodobacteraceae bacterium PARR1]|nr:MAG: efflux transporter periplasmic adaptor subunit [Rhodobacteraceae bacterium PARR1]
MRFPLLAPALFVALAVPALPVHAQTETESAAPAVTETLPAISVSTVEKRMLRDRVVASGLIAPVERILVAPLIEGQPIESLEADVGDYVQAGQILARLSRSTLELQKTQVAASRASARATIAQIEAQLIEARASADEAARVSTRTAALQKQGSASQAAADQANANAISASARVTAATQTLEAARAQLELAEAQMANIDLQLDRADVKAPVAGEITARSAVIGAVASAQAEPMFQMIKNGELELNVELAEVDLPRLAAGQTVRMRSIGLTEPLTGTVRLVEPTIDTATRLGRARISIDGDDAVRSGMFMDAEILIAEREALAVPVTAVGSSADGSTVMKVADGVVSRVPVKTGIRDGGWVEVLEGITPGDTIVTKAGAFVRDGDRINPVPFEPNVN